MEGLGILRVVTLFCLLAIGFHGGVVNAGQESTVVELNSKPRTFPEPSTVRDLLDFLGKLAESDLNAKITKVVSKKIKDYLKCPGILGTGIKQNLIDVIRGVVDLRKLLLKDPDHYGRYSLFNPFVDFIDHYAESLVRWLPILHSEMWFLHFQTDKECVHFAGGWRVFQRFGMSYYTTQLHRWLTDKLDRTTVPYIPKGFMPQDLHESNVGAHVSVKTGIHYHTGARLNHAQYGLFLVSPTWHDANLASAVLFLQEFCSEVQEKKFDKYDHHVDFDRAKPACAAFTTGIKFLTDILHPLYNGSTKDNPYKGMLKPEAFNSYVDWLGRNLGSLKGSLRRMSSKMSRWPENILYNCEYSGPFKYGFTFRYTGWEKYIKEKLPDAIQRLTASDTGSLSILYKLLMPRPACVGRLGVPSHTASFQPPLANQPPNIVGTFSLRDLLDLLGILGGTGVKTQIAKEVDKRVQTAVQTYIKTEGIPGCSVEKNLDTLLKTIPLLRSMILENPDQYGQYSDFDPDEDSVEYFVEALVHWLPILHSELWSLFFQTDKGCTKYGGGAWRGQKFGKSSNSTQLHRWFTDTFDRKSVPYISKGFKLDDLHDSNVGAQIALKTGIYFDHGGPLNYAQYGLFFLSPTWHDANLGSAVLFLQEFCSEVEGSKFDEYFPGSTIEPLKSSCERVTTGIKSLTDILHPLYDGSTEKNPYKGMLKPEAFNSYVDWLGRNLAGLCTALGGLAYGTVDWTRNNLKNASSAGPFKYGFMFKDSKWEKTNKKTLPPVIDSLTTSDTGSLSILYKVIRHRPVQAGRLGVPSHTASFQSPLANQPPNIAGTFSLRDLLDILGIVSGTGVKTQIAKEVDKKIQALLNLDGVPCESVESVLTEVFETILQLRRVLLKNPHNYERFSRFNPYEDSIDHYATAMATWLPMYHSELWFLYFQTSVECRYIGGGAWRNQKFGKSNGTTQLHKWLVSRGFSEEDLHDSNVGAQIAMKTGIYFNEGDHMNYAQYGLFLLSPTWNDANLASAVLFLREFCSEVHGNKFVSHASGNDTDALTSVCEVLSMGFAFLNDILHPLYDGSMDTYRGHLRPEAFHSYVEWLSRNLDGMKGSLGQMLSEASLWTGDIFNQGGLLGPFRYGFVFKDPKWERSIKVKQPTVLFSLTGQAPTPPSGIRQCRTPKVSA